MDSHSEIPTRPLKKRSAGKFPALAAYTLIAYCAFASAMLAIMASRLLLSLAGYTPSSLVIACLVILLGLAGGLIIGGLIPGRIWHLCLSLTACTLLSLPVKGICLLGENTFGSSTFTGALLTGLAAFFLPSFFCGLSAVMALQELLAGKTSRQVSLSVGLTLGFAALGAGLSILISMYVVIPWAGIDAAIRSLAFFWGCFTYFTLSHYQKIASLAICLVCLLIPLPASRPAQGWIPIDQAEGTDDSYAVISDGFILRLDSKARTGLAGIDLGTRQLLPDYASQMVDLAGDVNEKNILVIGGSGHTLAHLLESKGAQVVETSSDTALARLSDTYYQPIQGQTLLQDGRAYLESSVEDKFDAILVDVDGTGSSNLHLTTLEFFQIAEMHMPLEGRIVLHHTGLPGVDMSIVSSALGATLSAVFDEICTPAGNDTDLSGVLLVVTQDTLNEVNCEPVPPAGMLLRDDRNPLSFYLQVRSGGMR